MRSATAKRIKREIYGDTATTRAARKYYRWEACKGGHRADEKRRRYQHDKAVHRPAYLEPGAALLTKYRRALRKRQRRAR